MRSVTRHIFKAFLGLLAYFQTSIDIVAQLTAPKKKKYTLSLFYEIYLIYSKGFLFIQK